MKLSERFIILISLLFLLVEIWEPSTAFVREAVVIDTAQTSHSAFQHSYAQLSLHSEMVDASQNSHTSTGHDVLVVSHSSTGIAFPLFKSYFNFQLLSLFEVFSDPTGAYTILKRPPIAA